MAAIAADDDDDAYAAGVTSVIQVTVVQWVDDK